MRTAIGPTAPLGPALYMEEEHKQGFYIHHIKLRRVFPTKGA